MAWARSTSVGQHQKLSHPIHLLSPWIYIPSANSKKSQAFCRLRSLSPSKSRQCSFASCRADGSTHGANPHPVIVLDFDGARWPLHRQNHCRRQCHPSQAAKLTVMKPLTPALPPPTVLWHNPPSLLGTCQSAAQDCNQQKSVAWLYYTYNVNKTYLILKETFWKRDVPRWDGNVGVTETQTVLCESKKTAVNRESQYFNKTGWDSAATYKRMKERGWKDARIMKWMVYLTKGRPQMRQKLIH